MIASIFVLIQHRKCKYLESRILNVCSDVLKLWMNQPFNTTSCLESPDNETGEAKHVWRSPSISFIAPLAIHQISRNGWFWGCLKFPSLILAMMTLAFISVSILESVLLIHRNWLHVKRSRSEESQKLPQILSRFTFYLVRRWLLT